MSDVTVTKGAQVEFKVRIRGDPVPSVEWFKDGTPLANNPLYVVSHDELESTYYLVVPAAKEECTGNYSVRASNEHGLDEASVSIHRRS